MPRDINKGYRVVEQLPANALKVADYAKKIGRNHSILYHRLKRGVPVDYEIIIFQGFNFVVPLST